MFTLAHLSDIHLAPLPTPALHELMSKRLFGYVNWQRRRHQHRRDVLDRLMVDLIGQNPNHIAMTGDLVNIALPEEFRRARAWLDGLGVGGPEAITVIPGNHDAYVPFLRNPGVRHWQPYMQANAGGARFGNGRAFPFVQLHGEIALICLTSARPTLPGMASGWLGRRQMSAVGPILDALGRENFCRVVLIHHPPLPGMTDWQRALHDAGAFRTVLARHGAELVLHGHNHRAMIAHLDASSGPIPVIGAPSASLSSNQPGKRAAYNLFNIDKGGNGAWRIEMRSRVFDPEGRVEEVQQPLFL